MSQAKRAWASRRILDPVGDPLDAVSHEVGPEIQEQTESFVGEFEIGEELLWVNLGQLLHGLEFEDDSAFNKNVRAKSLLEPQALELEGEMSGRLDLGSLAGNGSRKGAKTPRGKPRTARLGVFAS